MTEISHDVLQTLTDDDNRTEDEEEDVKEFKIDISPTEVAKPSGQAPPAEPTIATKSSNLKAETADIASKFTTAGTADHKLLSYPTAPTKRVMFLPSMDFRFHSWSILVNYA